MLSTEFFDRKIKAEEKRPEFCEFTYFQWSGFFVNDQQKFHVIYVFDLTAL